MKLAGFVLQTVRNRVKVYAIADATDYLIELAFIVDGRKETGTPLSMARNEFEKRLRTHNELTEDMDGLWDILFKDKTNRTQRALDLIDEFGVA